MKRTIAVLVLCWGLWLGVCGAGTPPQKRGVALDCASRLNLAVHDLARQLLEHGGLTSGHYVIGVATLVNLDRLDLTAPLGRLVSEMLVGELQRAGYQVVELRLTRDILVEPGRGEFSLSRLAQRISSQVELNAVLVGTYLCRDGYLFLNLRLVSKEDQRVVATAFKVLGVDPLVSSLLYPVSAASRPTVKVKVRDFSSSP